MNRDDDPEEGDMGVRRQDHGSEDNTAVESTIREKTSNSSDDSSSRPAENIEMQERRDSESTEDDAREGQGRRTPPLAEYREGHHLVRERRTGDGDEVGHGVFVRR